jgi:hypothetical protein
MESLTNIYKYLLILFFSLLLSACANIYWGSIKNTTNEVITVKLTFSNEYGTRFLEFPVKSGENDLWEYEQSSLIITKIDKNLTFVEATNSEGCTIVFNRAAIDKKVENHELEVVIEPQDFIDACGKK